MNKTITSGNATIVDSGVSFTFGDAPLEIVLHDVEVKGSDFTIMFSFASDATNTSPRYEVVATDNPSSYHLKLINYSNPLGIGVLKPLEFASNKKGVRFYLSFMVSAWQGDLSKRLTYSIFRTEDAHEAH